MTVGTASSQCADTTSSALGLVRVSETFHFKYTNGKPYYPFGTTAYAWIHLGKEAQDLTLNTLKKTGFNKIRMCVFPKDYDLVEADPAFYPFEIKEIKNPYMGKAMSTCGEVKEVLK